MATPSSSQRNLAVHSHRAVPGKFFNPTHIAFSDLSAPTHDPNPVSEWNSRRARKGRYRPKTAQVHYLSGEGEDRAKAESDGGGKGIKSRSIEARVREVESEVKPGLVLDVSFWVAVAFTLGSCFWVVNGFVVWFPILRPNLATTPFVNGAAATAFLGGTIFEIGAYLMVVEALDRGRESSFGSALGELLHARRRVSPGYDANTLHETHEKARAFLASGASGSQSGGSSEGVQNSSPVKKFIWWGKPLWHDMGYVAALVQLFAASVFWIATLTGLPGVIPGLYQETESLAIVDVFYWTPQVVGGSGFIVASTILMLEVQKKWWLPNLFDVGWQIAFWNLIGSIGFTVCGALGYSSKSGAVYESALSTYWGSWAFLIGSVIQLYETLWREPPPKHSDTKGSAEKAK